MWSVVGCHLFAGVFLDTEETLDWRAEINFNSFLDAVDTLFQVFLGDTWDSTIYVGMYATNRWLSLSFFLSYFLCATFLISNLAVGIIVSTFHKVNVLTASASSG